MIAATNTLHLQVILTGVDIVLLAVFLAGFVLAITAKLQKVANTVAQIATGVQAIEGHTKTLNTGVTTTNKALTAAAKNLTEAVGHAQKLAGG